MPNFQSKWLAWESERPKGDTDKTDESSFGGFGSCVTRAFSAGGTPSEEIGRSMSDAIETLSELCPPDLFERLDWRLERERREISAMPLDSISAIKRWEKRWRILFAELLID